jgi:citrate/tricarballylate utilization protein
VLGSAIAALLAGTRTANGGAFYSVISHNAMVATFAAVFIAIVLVQAAGFLRFWRETKDRVAGPFRLATLWKAALDVLSMKNLSSNGVGCTYPDERHSLSRRNFHHLTFYGFLLCTVSTTVAAIYHSFFGWEAPHAYFSLPVVLGTAGGIGLIVGPIGLYRLKRRRDPAIGDSAQDNTDVSFLALLFLTSLTGLLLLALRETNAMGILLRIHLGVVLGLFLTLPYGKFVHGIYRSAALLRSALEASRSQNER